MLIKAPPGVLTLGPALPVAPQTPEEIIGLLTDQLKANQEEATTQRIAAETIVTIALALVEGILSNTALGVNEEERAILIPRALHDQVADAKLELSWRGEGDLVVRIVRRGHEDLLVVRGGA